MVRATRKMRCTPRALMPRFCDDRPRCVDDRVVEPAPPRDLARTHLRVGVQPAAGEAASLPGSRARHHARRAPPPTARLARVGQLAVVDLRHLDLQVEAIEQRPGDAPAIAPHRARGRRCTGAAPSRDSRTDTGSSPPPTRTPPGSATACARAHDGDRAAPRAAGAAPRAPAASTPAARRERARRCARG